MTISFRTSSYNYFFNPLNSPLHIDKVLCTIFCKKLIKPPHCTKTVYLCPGIGSRSGTLHTLWLRTDYTSFMPEPSRGRDWWSWLAGAYQPPHEVTTYIHGPIFCLKIPLHKSPHPKYPLTTDKQSFGIHYDDKNTYT